MQAFAVERKDWLADKLTQPGITPAHDTFNRIFQIIDPEQLSKGLAEDGKLLLESLKGELITIDGKKQRGVDPTSRGNSGLFILNAWVGKAGVCIGQTKVMEKSNEITAIPALLNELELQGSTVSIDAMGCQHEIANQIVDLKADYLLALKGNQGDLFEEVSEAFEYGLIQASDEDWEYDHGRYETRRCEVMAAAGYLSPNFEHTWSSVRQFVRITATRQTTGTKTSQTRYYLTSHAEDRNAAQLNALVRHHWSIENQLHWHLDVTFNEDGCRARTKNAPLNLSVMRKLALHRVKQDKSKLSQKKRRFKASMNTGYLDNLLSIGF